MNRRWRCCKACQAGRQDSSAKLRNDQEMERLPLMLMTAKPRKARNLVILYLCGKSCREVQGCVCTADAVLRGKENEQGIGHTWKQAGHSKQGVGRMCMAMLVQGLHNLAGRMTTTKVVLHPPPACKELSELCDISAEVAHRVSCYFSALSLSCPGVPSSNSALWRACNCTQWETCAVFPWAGNATCQPSHSCISG